MGSEMSLFFYFFLSLFPLLVMRQGPFYLGEDTFKEPKGKMIFFYQCLSLFTFCMYSKKDDNCYLLHDPSALFMNNNFIYRCVF